ncbi:MAG: nucleotidyl transferase AbiEii/AbiGii toxin family protein [Bacteroidia bacterium]|nr:nucleotidyl transferase AbiEii/AbiGii toxin family protein [Bacteroidia bacterium]
MLSLKEIKTFFPETLHVYEQFIFKEYLQYKILEIIFESPYADKLAFMGGTCLRIVYGNTRFSEDLDFDNFNLSIDNFTDLTRYIKTELERQGYEVEMRNVEKGAWHCYIRFPELLYRAGLTRHKEEKILIQLDTEPHAFDYLFEQPILNKFDVFTQINAVPEDLLLAQKFYAVVNRKRNKGRDFFDIVFLLSRGITPNYEYLHEKIGIRSPEDIRARVLEKCATLDMNEMALDVKSFLFDLRDVKKIILFPSYIQHAKLH